MTYQIYDSYNRRLTPIFIIFIAGIEIHYENYQCLAITVLEIQPDDQPSNRQRCLSNGSVDPSGTEPYK